MVLARYLEQPQAQQELKGRKCLELGAGCGLVGLAAALLGASVTLTDREETLSLLGASRKAVIDMSL